MTEAAAAPAVDVAAPATGGEAPAAAAPATPNPLVWDAEVGDWVAKTKVDGVESKRKFSDLHKDAQQAASAAKRYEDAKAIKVANASLTEQNRMLKESIINPQRAMAQWQEAGLDPRKMLNYMQQTLDAEERLTPEQRELREHRARAAQQEAQAREQEAKQREEAESAAEAAEYERKDKIFRKHMDRLTVPGDGELRGHVALLSWALHDQLVEAAERGEPSPMKASEIVAEAWSSMKTMAKEVVATLPPEELAALLGPELLTNIATRAVAGAAPIPRTVQRNMPPREPETGRFSTHTVFQGGSKMSFGRAIDRNAPR